MFVSPSLIGEFQAKCLAKGHKTLITCVDRTYKEQYAYFLQGREPLYVVNEARKRAGLPAITQMENKRCVTWTMNSEHVVNPDDERIDNDKSRAFDFAILYPDGKVNWDVKADVDNDQISDYDECADIAESLGLYSGRRFKNKDYPHVQVVPI